MVAEDAPGETWKCVPDQGSTRNRHGVRKATETRMWKAMGGWLWKQVSSGKEYGTMSQTPSMAEGTDIMRFGGDPA